MTPLIFYLHGDGFRQIGHAVLILLAKPPDSALQQQPGDRGLRPLAADLPAHGGYPHHPGLRAVDSGHETGCLPEYEVSICVHLITVQTSETTEQAKIHISLL